MVGKILKDCFTEDDNKTWDYDAFSHAFMVLLYSAFIVINIHHLTPVEAATGMTMLLGGRQVLKAFKKGKR